MRNLILLGALPAIFFLLSCKKDNSTPNSNSGPMPKTYTEDVRNSVIGNSVTTYNLTYDANKRITGITATPAPPSINFVYTYPAAGSLTLDLYEGGILNIHEIFWLNASSSVDSTFQFDDSGDTTTEKYVYNGNKQLVKQNTYDYSSSVAILSNSTNYTYDNLGNVISSEDNQGTSITFTYYTNLPNTLNLGQTFLPQSLYFIKTATLNSGGSTETASHYYTFDGNNRLIKDSSSTPEISLIAIKSYTY